MVTTLYLIRHGETEGAEVRRHKGSIDVPLSQEGIKQMEKTASFMKDSIKAMAAVYTSDLIRAIKSAEVIAGDFGISPIVVSGLRERSFGLWEGMSFDEIKEKYPDAFGSWAKDPLRFSPMGGESTIEVKERVMPAFHEILKRHGGDTISIVSHGGVNRVILCSLLGMPLENIFRIEQDYGALNIIEFWDGVPVIKLINGRRPC